MVPWKIRTTVALTSLLGIAVLATSLVGSRRDEAGRELTASTTDPERAGRRATASWMATSRPDGAGIGPDTRGAIDGQARALERLEELGVAWDVEALRQVPASAEAALDITRPLELARKFGVTDLAFLERRKNGRDVYRTPDGQTTVKFDLEHDYWKLIRKPPDAPAGRVLTDPEVDTNAADLAVKLNVPPEQRGPTRDSALVGGNAHGEAVLGHEINLTRIVNGLRVDGSRVTALYDDQETPVYAEARWPPFVHADAASLKQVDEALVEIAGVLGPRFADGQDDYDLKHKLTYQQDERGQYEPVLTVWLFERSTVGTPEVVEYSLVRGVKFATLMPTETRSDVEAKEETR